MKTGKFTLISTILAAAFGLALGLMAAPSDGYGCHLGNKHVGVGDCGGGGGGGDGGDVATNETDAKWSGSSYSNIREDAARRCFLEFAGTNGNGGHYKCPLLPTQDVIFNLSGGTERDKRGQPVDSPSGICEQFNNDLAMAPNTNYEVHWEGLCTSPEGCEIRVLNWFFDLENAPDADNTGLLIVEGFGRVDSTSNPNPFADSHEIDIDFVRITIKGEGTNKTLAICEYSNPGVGFESIPVPE